MSEEGSVLYRACASGNADFVEYLLHKGADPNYHHPPGCSCLSAALRTRDLAVVKLLVQHGATVNAEPGHTSPLCAAAADGDAELATVLLQAAADTTHKNTYGLTPLHLASAQGYTDIVTLLLHHQQHQEEEEESSEGEYFSGTEDNNRSAGASSNKTFTEACDARMGTIKLDTSPDSRNELRYTSDDITELAESEMSSRGRDINENSVNSEIVTFLHDLVDEAFESALKPPKAPSSDVLEEHGPRLNGLLSAMAETISTKAIEAAFDELRLDYAKSNDGSQFTCPTNSSAISTLVHQHMTSGHENSIGEEINATKELTEQKDNRSVFKGQTPVKCQTLENQGAKFHDQLNYDADVADDIDVASQLIAKLAIDSAILDLGCERGEKANLMHSEFVDNHDNETIIEISTEQAEFECKPEEQEVVANDLQITTPGDNSNIMDELSGETPVNNGGENDVELEAVARSLVTNVLKNILTSQTQPDASFSFITEMSPQLQETMADSDDGNLKDADKLASISGGDADSASTKQDVRCTGANYVFPSSLNSVLENTCVPDKPRESSDIISIYDIQPNTAAESEKTVHHTGDASENVISEINPLQGGAISCDRNNSPGKTDEKTSPVCLSEAVEINQHPACTPAIAVQKHEGDTNHLMAESSQNLTKLNRQLADTQQTISNSDKMANDNQLFTDNNQQPADSNKQVYNTNEKLTDINQQSSKTNQKLTVCTQSFTDSTQLLPENNQQLVNSGDQRANDQQPAGNNRNLADSNQQVMAGQKRKEYNYNNQDGDIMVMKSRNRLNKRRRFSRDPGENRRAHVGVINLQTRDGKTALYLACENRKAAVARLLLQQGADTSVGERHFGLTPPHVAALVGDTETMGVLLRENVKVVDRRSRDGSTPLFLAACAGQGEAVRVLLEHGADPDLAREGGWSPLHTASEKDHSDIAELLIRGRATINSVNAEGATPLYQAACHGRAVTIKLLTSYGADVNLATRGRWSPLHIACKNSHLPAITLLLSHGADVNLQSVSGATALLRACQAEDAEVAEMLLRHGADPDLADKDGLFPLLVVTQLANERLAEMLVRAGADVNRQWEGEEGMGLSPLHVTCIYGYRELACLILENHGNGNIQDQEGFTPLEWSEESGHGEVTHMIQKYEQEVAEAAETLANMKPAIRGNEEENMRVWIQLHPHIAARYIPVRCPGDKTTVWDMVSLCLSGGIEHRHDLRRVTASIIARHPVFRTILYNELKETGVPGAAELRREADEWEAVARAVNTLSSQALAPQSAGNKYHLLALSIAVRRPIYVYKSCQDPAGLYYYMKKGVAELQKAFRDRLEGTEQHIRFQLDTELDRNRRPIFGFTADGSYFPLLPKSPTTDLFQPATDLLQSYTAAKRAHDELMN